MKTIFLIILCFPLFAAPSNFQQIVDKLKGLHKHPSVALIIKSEDDVSFFNSKDKIIKKDSIVEIASNTKAFTYLLFLEAVNKNTISFNSTINEAFEQKLVPPTLNQYITLRHLANHTAGLSNFPYKPKTSPWEDPFLNYELENLKKFLKSLRPYSGSSWHKCKKTFMSNFVNKPGVCTSYSNLAYAVLGHAVAATYKIPYKKLIQEQILDPLNLNDSGFILSDEQKNRKIQGFNSKGEKVNRWHLGAMGPSGALMSTPLDMLNFLNYYSNKVLANKNFPMLVWRKYMITGKRFYYHSGLIQGFSSFMGFNPETKQAFFLVSNKYGAFDKDNSLGQMGMVIMRELSKTSEG